MAKNSTPYFFLDGASGCYSVTASAADVTSLVGQTEDSFVSVLSVVNSGATARTLTVYDGNDNVIGVVTIPANAGNVVGTPPVDLVNSRLIAGCEYDGYGNSGIRLFNGDKIKAKQDTGTDLRLHWKRLDY